MPEIGGETVFIRLGLKIKADSRSALLWHNLNENLEGDINTYHGACPVVLGSKWIAEKWFRQNEQIFARPCGLIEKKQEIGDAEEVRQMAEKPTKNREL